MHFAERRPVVDMLQHMGDDHSVDALVGKLDPLQVQLQIAVAPAKVAD